MLPTCSLREGRNVILPGQVFDGEAGLHQNGFRDYDPAVGRYAQSDPIGLTGGINTYAYVKDGPLSRIDSLGLYAYGDVVAMWNHYCDGSGTDRTTSFNSINWGDTSNRVLAHVMALIGQSCAERSIPVSFNLGAQTAGADQFIIGRHVVKTGGTISVHCDCTWSFTGNLSSALGYDPFDFDASNRGFVGETLTWIGGHRCPNSGKAFNIYLPGQQSLSSSGTVNGTPTCCRK
jgi:RHS repeat-associated protein